MTVGTTKFDALIKVMDSVDVADELASRKYTSLIMQVTFHLRHSISRDNSSVYRIGQVDGPLFTTVGVMAAIAMH